MKYVVLFWAVLSVANSARSQPCCTGTGPQELGVLGLNQTGLLGTELSTNIAQGSFDRTGRYRGLTSGQSIDSIMTVGGAYRLWIPQLQISGQLPIHTQFRSFKNIPSKVATGLGDIGLGLRYRVYNKDLDRRLLFQVSLLDLHSQIVFPTGRSIEDASAQGLGADVTGEGVTAAGVGGRLVLRFFGESSIRLSGQYQSRVATSLRLKVGDLVTARCHYDYLINLRSIIGIGLRYRHVFTPDASMNESVRYGSRRLRVVGTFIHHVAPPLWTLITRIAWDPPVDAISTNLPFAGLHTVVGLRRIFL